MATKKRAKRPAPPRAPANPDMPGIVEDLQDTIDRGKDANVPTGSVAKPPSLFDRLAVDYKTFASGDPKWLLRRFDGLRVLTNVKDAPRSGFNFSPWASEKEDIPAELTFDAYDRLLGEIFGPEKDVDGMYDFYHYQAFVRDWRIKLGVQPTTPMRDRMLDERVLRFEKRAYLWRPAPQAVKAYKQELGLWTDLEEIRLAGWELKHGFITEEQYEDIEADLVPEQSPYEVEIHGKIDGLAFLERQEHQKRIQEIWTRPITREQLSNPAFLQWVNDPDLVKAAGLDNYHPTAEELEAIEGAEEAETNPMHDFVSYGYRDRWQCVDETYLVTGDGVLDLSRAVVGNLGECPVSPWAFAGLAEVRGVRELRMSGYGPWFYPIGYAGLLPGGERRPLQPLVPPGAPLRASLRVLDLSGNYFDSLGLFLEGLTGLEVLHLDDTNIADAEALVATLAKHCPKIETVTLSGTLLDDGGMALVAAWLAPGAGWRGTGLHPEDS